jgi:hypothetical protein
MPIFDAMPSVCMLRPDKETMLVVVNQAKKILSAGQTTIATTTQTRFRHQNSNSPSAGRRLLLCVPRHRSDPQRPVAQSESLLLFLATQSDQPPVPGRARLCARRAGWADHRWRVDPANSRRVPGDDTDRRGPAVGRPEELSHGAAQSRPLNQHQHPIADYRTARAKGARPRNSAGARSTSMSRSGTAR